MAFSENPNFKNVPIFFYSVDNFGTRYEKNKDVFLIRGQNFTLVWMANFKIKSRTDLNFEVVHSNRIAILMPDHLFSYLLRFFEISFLK